MSEGEQRTRHDQALRQIQQLRQEVDDLQNQINSRMRETEQLKDENLKLSEICDLRQLDLQNAKRDQNKARDDIKIDGEHHDRLSEQQILLEDECRSAQMRNNELKRNIEELQRRLRDKEQLLDRLLEEFNQLNDKGQQFDNDNQDIQREIQQVNIEIKGIDKENLNGIKQIRNMEAHISKLNDESKFSQQDASRMSKGLSMEQARNREIDNRILQLTDALNNKDKKTNDIENQCNEIQQENQKIIETNGQMKDDWDALKEHINVLLKVNQELLFELEQYCDDDDRVKDILNRRQRINELSLRVSQLSNNNVKVQSGLKLKNQTSFVSSLKQSPMKSTQMNSASLSGSKKKYSNKKNY